MLMRFRSFAFVGLICGLLSPALTTSVQAQALGPGDLLDGKTQKEWGADWWRWHLTLPVGSDLDLAHNSLHPGIEVTGQQGYKGVQTGSDKVFFLTGSTAGINGQETVHRTLTIEGEKYLFFPLIDAYFDNTVPKTDPLSPPTNLTPDEMLSGGFGLDLIRGFDAATLFAEVDGVALSGLNGYRQTHGGAGFSVVYENEENINGWAGYDVTLGTGVLPSSVITAADGYYLALNPLTGGNHTVHFGGTLPLYDASGTLLGTFNQDITYSLSIVPEPGSITLLAGVLVSGAIFARRRSRR